MEAASMSIDTVVTDLLLRWENNPSLTPEEICREYKDHPEYAALLAAVQRGIRHLQAAASFLDTSPEDSSGSQRTVQPTEGFAVSSETPAASAAPGLRYRPVSFHAKGGLGEVFRAEDEELHREVALKRIQERHWDNAESHRRFLREAEITAKLQHPGIVPVYGLASDEDGQPCYAMRFIEGGTLDDAIKRFHEAERKPGRDPG
jgi:serine/threonine protein kinase